jgi:hypothetical protein
MPMSRFAFDLRHDPRKPLARLILCFLSSDWESIFIEEEIINVAGYFLDRRVNIVLEPPVLEMERGREAMTRYEELRRVVEEHAMRLWDSFTATRVIHRGEPLGASIWAAAAELRAPAANDRIRNTVITCVDCASPAMPGERTCYSHHRK